MSVKQICETVRGLEGQECPCKNYTDDMSKGIWDNFYARLQVAADAGCLNAMCVVANKFQMIHCVVKHVEDEKFRVEKDGSITNLALEREFLEAEKRFEEAGGDLTEQEEDFAQEELYWACERAKGNVE